MEVHLRFGMHRNVPIIHDEIESIDGAVIPMHILAYQEPSTSAFITSLCAQDRPYLLDPMSFIFQNPIGNLTSTDDSGQRYIRPSIDSLTEAYHQDLGPYIDGLSDPSDQLAAQDFPDITQIARNVAEYQLSAVDQGANRSAASK